MCLFECNMCLLWLIDEGVVYFEYCCRMLEEMC